jgi:hypothetical protein
MSNNDQDKRREQTRLRMRKMRARKKDEEELASISRAATQVDFEILSKEEELRELRKRADEVRKEIAHRKIERCSCSMPRFTSPKFVRVNMDTTIVPTPTSFLRALKALRGASHIELYCLDCHKPKKDDEYVSVSRALLDVIEVDIRPRID